jgi:hypothetical protein
VTDAIPAAIPASSSGTAKTLTERAVRSRACMMPPSPSKTPGLALIVNGDRPDIQALVVTVGQLFRSIFNKAWVFLFGRRHSAPHPPHIKEQQENSQDRDQPVFLTTPQTDERFMRAIYSDFPLLCIV